MAWIRGKGTARHSDHTKPASQVWGRLPPGPGTQNSLHPGVLLCTLRADLLNSHHRPVLPRISHSQVRSRKGGVAGR